MENEYGYGYGQTVPQRKLKKKSKVLPVIGILVGLALLVMGVLGFIGASDNYLTAEDMAETHFADIRTTAEYYVKVLVVDYMGTHTVNGEEKEDYYLGVFSDADETRFYCVVRAEKDSDFYRTLEDYATDESMMIGDLIAEGYYSFTNVSSVTGLEDSYKETVADYDDMIAEELGHVTRSSYILDLIAADDAAYQAHLKSENSAVRVAAVICGAIGLLFLLLAILHIRRINKHNAQVKQAAAAPAAYAAPQQPEPACTPYAQPQQEPQPTYTPYVQPETPAAEPATAPQEPQESQEPQQAAHPQDGTEPF